MASGFITTADNPAIVVNIKPAVEPVGPDVLTWILPDTIPTIEATAIDNIPSVDPTPVYTPKVKPAARVKKLTAKAALISSPITFWILSL